MVCVKDKDSVYEQLENLNQRLAELLFLYCSMVYFT